MIKRNKQAYDSVKGNMVMTLRASKMRSFIILFFGCSFGYIAFFSDIPNSLSEEYTYYITGMCMGVFFGTLIPFLFFLPNKYADIVINNNTLTAPSKPLGFRLPRTITVNLSDIDLSQSKITFSGGAQFRTNDGTILFISPMFHSRKSIRKLFDELKRIKGQAL